MASGVKIDLAKVAQLYGMTYHTLENRLRKTKKFAKELEAGKAPTTVATTRKPKTPKKDPLETVANGMITKKTPNKTPTKKVKQEELEDETASIFSNGQNIETVRLGSEMHLLDADDDMFTSGFLED